MADDVLIVNLNEGHALERAASRSLLEIASEFRVAVVVTRGDEGSDLLVNGSVRHVAACPPRRVTDATGAGDAFAAGLGCALLESGDLHRAVEVGASLASFVVEDLGCQSTRVSRAEVLGRARRGRGPAGPVG